MAAPEVSSFSTAAGLPLEVLYELVQFVRLGDCIQLSALTSTLVPIIFELEKRLEDVATVRVTVIYVRIPDAAKQLAMVEELIERMYSARYRIGDVSGDLSSAGSKQTNFGEEGKKKWLEKFRGGVALLPMLAGGSTSAIAFKGSGVWNAVGRIIDESISGLNMGGEVVHLPHSRDGAGWDAHGWHGGKGVVFALEGSGDKIEPEFFSDTGPFEL